MQVQVGVQVSPAALSSDTYRSKSMKFITDWDLFFLKDPCGIISTVRGSTVQHSTGKKREVQYKRI